MMIIAADYSTMSQDTIHFVIHRVVGLHIQLHVIVKLMNGEEIYLLFCRNVGSAATLLYF